MNFQNIRTFIANNSELSIKNGIIRFMISNIIFVSLISIVSFIVFYNQAFEKQKIEIVKEQINLIYVGSENSRMTSDFKEVSKAIYKLSQVDEVFILDNNCNIIESIGVSFKGSCNSTDITDNWIFLQFDSTFSKIAYIAVKVKKNIFFGIDKKIIFTLFVFLTVIIIMTLISYNFFEKYIKNPLDAFISIIPQISQKDFSIVNEKDYPTEITPLINALNSTHKELEVVKSKLADEVEIETKINIAKQVAHDIRSPLTALDMIIEHLDEVQEDKKNLIKKSHDRIKKIADDLLSYSKINNSFRYNLKEAISDTIEEKKIEFKNKFINFYLNIQNSDFEVNSKLSKEYFQRILSNLINNSVESILHNYGEINIYLSLIDNTICVTVKDNGSGIPQELIKKIGKKGFSYGKEKYQSGSGLGIYGAKKKLSEINGNLDIQSKINHGTEIKLFIPVEIAKK